MGIREVLNDFTACTIIYDQPLSKKTSIGVGGKATFFAEADSLYSLNKLINIANEYKTPYKVIGNGTNVLFSDKGFDGLVICLRRLNDIFFKRDEVCAMAGATLDKLIRFNLSAHLQGAEMLWGIPACIGGAIVMNAGAFGHNISEYITTVSTLKDGKIKIYNKNECGFGYRKSRFKGKKETVVSASFLFPEGEKERIADSIKSFSELRKYTQPQGRSCGSVFKNPKPHTAGILIDKLGLKGYSIGGASISEKHANFIITKADAKAQDVYDLIQYIKMKVRENFDINLEEEVEFIGEF